MASVGAIRFFGFFFGILAILFLIIATPTHHWYHAETVSGNTTRHFYGGIFEDCTSVGDSRYTCVSSSGSGYLKATKAFLSLAIVVFAVAIIYTLIWAFMRGICYKVLGGLIIAAGLLTMIGMSIYTDKHKVGSDVGHSYGYSYGLGWASVVFSIIAGILLCFGQPEYEKL